MNIAGHARIMKVYNKISKYLTAIKMVSITILLLGLFDNLTSPLQHIQGGGTTEFESSSVEWVIRSVFIFCGMFGILGNGGTRRVRATVVAIPLVYLTTFYFILYLQYHNTILFVPMILAGTPAAWILLFGDLHD